MSVYRLTYFFAVRYVSVQCDINEYSLIHVVENKRVYPGNYEYNLISVYGLIRNNNNTRKIFLTSC